MKRKFLLTLGWLSAAGSVFDLLLAAYAAFLVFIEPAYDWRLSTEVLFRDHLTWLYWVKQLAYILFNEELITWAFSLPAMLFFAVRAVISFFIGGWAFKAAERQ